ncbi:16S rRNA (uracil(1498)-N(3))-methyltransferase [Turicibacter sanguinis]|nr:16S rRNA (uracil(1498)-N(3))-methyltransferase [Turicibacter sanguinis]
MQRYFLKNHQFQAKQVRIADEDAHHIARVMRMEVGERIIVCNEDKECYYLTITAVTPDEVTGEIGEAIESDTELPIEVTIAQGLPKGDKFEWVIQKATECGATNFMPVSMERCVVKLDAKKEVKKVERWNKIAKEAAEQSHRQVVPKVHSVHTFKAFLEQSKHYDVCLFAYEETAKQGELAQLKQTLENIKLGATLLLLVGPEGGVGEKEVDLLIQHGFKPCALGPRILRTETAPIYALSAISFALEF